MEKLDKLTITENDIENLYSINTDFSNDFYNNNELTRAHYFLKKSLDLAVSLYKRPNNRIKNLKKQIILIKEKFIEVSKKLGDMSFCEYSVEKALNYYKDILYYEPKDVDVYKKISTCLIKLKAYNSSISILEKILILDSNDIEAVQELGKIYDDKLKDFNTAIKYYKLFLAQNPEDPKINYRIGLAYERIDKYDYLNEQIFHFEKTLKSKPKLKALIRHLAIVYQRAEEYKKAIECYKKLFSNEPMIDDYFNYSLLMIFLKNFKEGWKYYEYRFTREHKPAFYPNDLGVPQWKGRKIKDKTLFIFDEQGFGDILMFARYIKQIKPLVGKIIFRVHDSLVELIKSNFKDIDVIGFDTDIYKLNFDYHLPLVSIMSILNTSVETIPFSDGYIKANRVLTEKYKQKYFNNKRLKIGISWAGKIEGNEKRNVPLELFYQLTKLDNVEVYSFQKGIGADDLKKMPQNIPIIDLGKTFKNFSDTAAAMKNLDLFITSDNVLLNLAGAMGIKTFLLQRKDSDWRWFTDTEKTPWYNSVKMFKKKNENEDWQIAMNKVIDEVKISDRLILLYGELFYFIR